MGSLKVFKDYDDPVIKLEAERKVEEEILPRTAALMSSLKLFMHSVEALENKGGCQSRKFFNETQNAYYSISHYNYFCRFPSLHLYDKGDH